MKKLYKTFENIRIEFYALDIFFRLQGPNDLPSLDSLAPEWTMGQWVMGHGSDGSHKWMGQMGHGSWLSDP